MQAFFSKYIQSFQGLSKESWLLSLVMLINRSGAMVMPFMGIYLHKELGYELSELGIVLSCYGIGALIGSWLGGELTDKFGSYSIQLFSLLACIPFYIALPFFKDLTSISVLLIALSCINETFRPANSVAITNFASADTLTRAFSLNRLAINLGFSIGPAIGGILSAISFDLLFYVNAIGCLIAALIFILFFKNRKNAMVIEKEDIEPNTSLPVSPYKDYTFLFFTLFCTLFSISFFQLLNTIPLFFEQALKLSQFDIGLIMGYSGFIIVLIEMPLIAFAEKRMSVIQVMVYGTLFTALSFYLYTLNQELFFIYIAISFLSIGEILVLPFMSTVTALRSNESNKGVYMGINGLSMGIGLIISPILGTYIIKYYGFSFLWIATSFLLVITAIGYKITIAKMKEIA